MHYLAELPDWALERARRLRQPIAFIPDRTAVIVIDMQNFFLTAGYPMANRHGLDIIPNINRIVEAYRRAECTIVVVQHSFRHEADAANRAPDLKSSLRTQLLPGHPAFDLHPDLAVAPTDLRVVKHTPSLLHPRSGCEALALLHEHGIDTLAITGLVTNGCCEATARDAYQHGFNVLFAADATATVTDEEHNASLLNLAAWFAEVRTSADLVALAADTHSWNDRTARPAQA